MNWWLLLAIIAAVIWGMEYAIGEKVLSKTSALMLLFWTSLIQTVACYLVAISSGNSLNPKELLEPDLRWWFSLYALLSLIAGLAINVSIKQSSNATNSSLVEISYPFFVAIFSWLLFGEQRLSWRTIVSGALIVISIWLIDNREK